MLFRSSKRKLAKQKFRNEILNPIIAPRAILEERAPLLHGVPHYTGTYHNRVNQATVDLAQVAAARAYVIAQGQYAGRGNDLSVIDQRHQQSEDKRDDLIIRSDLYDNLKTNHLRRALTNFSRASPATQFSTTTRRIDRMNKTEMIDTLVDDFGHYMTDIPTEVRQAINTRPVIPPTP